ncbi:MAG: accessory factor UbiK family protein [Alphaproteobacteria bacterium]
MQTTGKLFDDLARVANGAAGAMSGVKDEVEQMVRARLERVLADMDLVTREEFDAVKAMATKARQEQESLSERVEILENTLAKMAEKPAKKPARKSPVKKTLDSDSTN